MPYNKNKQQAFQAAQQGTHQAQDVFQNIVKDSREYGQQLQHLKNEVDEAYQQIDNALEVASEHQADQLQMFKNDLDSIQQQMNQSQ